MIRSGVVDNFGCGAATRHNHRVPRRRLAELPVEKQVAWLGRAHIPAYEVGVALNQRFGVGELCKCAAGQIFRRKCARRHAEQRRTQRRVRVAPRANFSRRRRNLNAAGLKPDVVVPLEGFSIRITQQARAIGNLRGRLRLRPRRLVLGNQREPAAKRRLVGRIGQAHKVWRSVAVAIAPVEHRRPYSVLSRLRMNRQHPTQQSPPRRTSAPCQCENHHRRGQRATRSQPHPAARACRRAAQSNSFSRYHLNTKPHQSYGISSTGTRIFFRKRVRCRSRRWASPLALPLSRHRTLPCRNAYARKKCNPRARRRRLKANDLAVSIQASSVSGRTQCVQTDTRFDNRQVALDAC